MYLYYEKENNKYANKFFKMSKRNIIKIITIFFWGYLGLSLIFTLKDFFMSPDWNQIVMQYSKSEIITKCTSYIIIRFYIKKHSSNFYIFRNQISY